MNTRAIAGRIVTAAEKHGQDTCEPDHAFGDLEEALVACLNQFTAEQFVAIADALKEQGVPRLGPLVKACKCSPKARLSNIIRGIKTCQQCGSPLKGRFCSDETCPFSDWPQKASLFDLQNMHPFHVEEKNGIKRRNK